MNNIRAHEELLSAARGISRRSFVKGVGTVMAGGALIALSGRLPVIRRQAEVPGETLARSTFAGLLGETFRVYGESAGMPALSLAAVRDLQTTARELGRAPMDEQRERSFSLLFTGTLDRTIGQGTYRFEHDRLGTFSLFIVPMAPGEDAHYYEAIFNRQRA